MPVSVNYKGRFGNNVFQYISARIFSEKNNLLFNDSLNNNIINFSKHKNITDDNQIIQNIKVNHSSFDSNDEILFYGKNINYQFDDFFQNVNYINNNLQLVESFFNMEEIKDKNSNDIVMHLRLDDYLHTNNILFPESWDKSEIINPNYYINILNNESFNDLYIVVDKINYDWEKKYLSYFDNFSPKIITQTPKEDFEFIRKFNKIITSNSTFCYWAAFLSDAEKIYTFNKVGFYGKDLIKHGEHVKNLDNIKNKSISINEEFYFNF